MSGYAYIVENGKAREIPLHDAAHATGDLVWTHLCTNDHRARQWLGVAIGLPAYVTDALTADETRPRCDAMGDGAFINLRGPTPTDTPSSDPLASIRIYAIKGHVFSVTRNTLSALDPVRAQVKAGTVLDPGDLIAAMAQAITEELDPMVADLGDALDACEERMDIARTIELRRGVAEVRIQAIGYRRFLSPQRIALEKLAALPGDWLHEDDRIHLSAAADRAARMAEELESIRERAALTHEMLTDLRSEQIDQRSLLIAVVALVFLPLTFLTGALGMNVAGIPFSHEPWAFAGVMVVCVLIGLAITIFFLRRRWFAN